MCILYVYGIIFWERIDDDIHDLAIKLRYLGVDLEQEDDAAGFLGMALEQDLNTLLL